MPENDERVEQAPPEGRKLRPRLNLRPLLTVLFLAALFGAFYAGTQLKQLREDPQPAITSDVLQERLESVQELVSLDYHYTNMGKYENQLDFYGWKVPFTNKSFLVSYDGLIKAGVDLSAISVRVDETARRVTITLPKSKILSHEILEDSVQVFDETRNIFNPISVENYTQFTRDQKAEMEQKVIGSGLLDQASEKARESIHSLLQLIPGIERYSLTVK